ncbi:hypothetical protein AVEN_66047-1 [Araneus ventricosus]|uniref:DDE-1 domain-containing protein n=1 Tax=Araneus ventricosus TaxID=182803 RepID=A0A4Y2JWK8_ARAVE|nr:hypothetical protein AVEN_66047-1 [Araneus ventricosus]
MNYQDHMIRGAPSGTLGLATQSGWMNSEVFPQVLDHFISHMGCSIQKPAVLFIDNHESHLGIEVIDKARENGLSIITFPTHTSHKMQPLDVSEYGPLKSHYEIALNEWNLSNPGKRITIYDLPECFSRAFYKALSLENISSGFKRTGIWPINSEILSDHEFQAAGVFMIDNRTLILDVSNSVHKEKQPLDYEDDLNEPSTSAKHSTANVIDRSFSEIAAIRPLPKRKAKEPLNHVKGGQTLVASLLQALLKKKMRLRNRNKNQKPCARRPSICKSEKTVLKMRLKTHIFCLTIQVMKTLNLTMI